MKSLKLRYLIVVFFILLILNMFLFYHFDSRFYDKNISAVVELRATQNDISRNINIHAGGHLPIWFYVVKKRTSKDFKSINDSLYLTIDGMSKLINKGYFKVYKVNE
jgi:hypothetical protein